MLYKRNAIWAAIKVTFSGGGLNESHFGFFNWVALWSANIRVILQRITL